MGKKIIAIGDIHGRDIRKKIVDKNMDADHIVFMGDYFDSKDNISPDDQKSNFDEIIKFKKENMNKVVLLLGNHDYHYLPYVKEHYSGFMPTQKYDIGTRLDRAVNDGLIKIAYLNGEYLFTHAGLSENFLEVSRVANHIDVYLNAMFMTVPEYFAFNRLDESGMGYSIHQGPLRIRPESLKKCKLPGYTHVIGHTQHEAIRIPLYQDIIPVDTLHVGQYLILGGERPEVGFIDKYLSKGK